MAEVLRELQTSALDLQIALDVLVDGCLVADGVAALAEEYCEKGRSGSSSQCLLCWRCGAEDMQVLAGCSHAFCKACLQWWVDSKKDVRCPAPPCRNKSSWLPFSLWGEGSIARLEAILGGMVAKRTQPPADGTWQKLLADWTMQNWLKEATLNSRWPASVVLCVEPGAMDERDALQEAAGKSRDVCHSLLRWRRSPGAAAQAQLSASEALKAVAFQESSLLAAAMRDLRVTDPENPRKMVREVVDLVPARFRPRLQHLEANLFHCPAAVAAALRKSIKRVDDLKGILSDADCVKELKGLLGEATFTRLKEGLEAYNQKDPSLSLEDSVLACLDGQATIRPVASTLPAHVPSEQVTKEEASSKRVEVRIEAAVKEGSASANSITPSKALDLTAEVSRISILLSKDFGIGAAVELILCLEDGDTREELKGVLGQDVTEALWKALSACTDRKTLDGSLEKCLAALLRHL